MLPGESRACLRRSPPLQRQTGRCTPANLESNTKSTTTRTLHPVTTPTQTTKLLDRQDQRASRGHHLQVEGSTAVCCVARRAKRVTPPRSEAISPKRMPETEFLVRRRSKVYDASWRRRSSSSAFRDPLARLQPAGDDEVAHRVGRLLHSQDRKVDYLRQQ
jgi:hypothetical protein